MARKKNGSHRWLASMLVPSLLASPAEGQIQGTYVAGYFPPDPTYADTERPDLIAVTNTGSQRILSFGMYLAAGVDADHDGLGLFFDTRAPSDEAPPSAGETQPGFQGAARLRVESASALRVGYVQGSERFVAYPGTLLGSHGDGAVQLITVTCDHFEPGATIRLGIDVDGFDDYRGFSSDDPLPAGLTVATGQAVVENEGQVYFDIVSGPSATPVAVPIRTPWLLVGGLVLAIQLAMRNRARRGAGFW